MAIARSTRESIPFVLVAERSLPPEQQTTFHLAPLPHHLLTSILDLMAKNENGKWIELAIAAGLRGWDNFPDETGAATPFTFEPGPRTIAGVLVKRPVAAETLDRIPSSLLVELAKAIVDENRLTEADAKN